ncbi:MAG: right-handed parallel beta-helix repeat-containing protein, partial [Aestuariibacter sp.]|nr:right-handed parallel beta-helix repeat-containing protein [Aestuariibacter sp.]
TAPGSKPTVINTGAGDVIALTGDNTHITGLLIDGNSNGDDGIDGGSSNKTNIAITQNMIQNTGDINAPIVPGKGRGVEFDTDAIDITVSGNTILNTNWDGVFFDTDAIDITVSGNTISNIELGSGVTIRDKGTGITVSGNTISNAISGAALIIAGQNEYVTVSGNTISDVISGSGMSFYSFTRYLTISGNTISNVGGTGISGSNNNYMTTISGNTISNVEYDGVYIGHHSIATVSGNTFTDIGSGGANDDVIEFNGTGNTLLPGSTGNVATTAPHAGKLCNGNFTGTFEVTDHNGVLQTFVNGAGC